MCGLCCIDSGLQTKRNKIKKIKNKKNKKKRRKKKAGNLKNPQKSHVVLYLHSSLGLLVNECVTQLQSNTHYSIYTKRNAIKLGRGCRL